MRQTANRIPEPDRDHPYIVRTEGICGGSPRIRDSRISVRVIAGLYRQGEPVGEILDTYPHLDPAAVDDAIGYYLDHRQEIDAEIEAGSLEAVLAETGALLDDDGVIRFPKQP
ncbi:MAG: DUF433 domain-containing protein [Thermoanaerobaculia bacterium]